MDGRWQRVVEEGFEVFVPTGWEAEADLEDGGVDVWNPQGAGDLHLVGFEDASAEMPDPAVELYAFLDEQEIELEEDEVEDLELADGGEMAICEYETEGEEDGEAAYWLVGVASLPGRLVFAHYSCTAGEEAAERDAILEILRSIRSRAG